MADTFFSFDTFSSFQPLTAKELARMKVNIDRSRPLSDDAWSAAPPRG